MADAKKIYSDMAKHYVDNNTNNADSEYNRSKSRESKYNANWLKQKVNINEIVEKFAPNAQGEQKGNVKYIFSGERYDVVADLASGYLRIYDKVLRKNVKLDGTIGNRKETHYKIKRREEMND